MIGRPALRARSERTYRSLSRAFIEKPIFRRKVALTSVYCGFCSRLLAPLFLPLSIHPSNKLMCQPRASRVQLQPIVLCVRKKVDAHAAGSSENPCSVVRPSTPLGGYDSWRLCQQCMLLSQMLCSPCLGAEPVTHQSPYSCVLLMQCRRPLGSSLPRDLLSGVWLPFQQAATDRADSTSQHALAITFHF
jgi:hypothetical protein